MKVVHRIGYCVTRLYPSYILFMVAAIPIYCMCIFLEALYKSAAVFTESIIDSEADFVWRYSGFEKKRAYYSKMKRKNR